MSPKIVIEGITEKGEKFRPSDWAERVSGHLLTVKNHRMYYSPLLKPSVQPSGHKCLVLDHTLKSSNPELYKHIIDFASTNNLKMCEDDNYE
jgi:hypothetical protein